MRITYRQIPPTTVYYARATGPYASSCEAAWQRLDAWLDHHCARGRVRRAFGVFHDNPRTTAPELLRYDACVPLIACAEFELAPGIGRQALPGGAWAVYTHVGAYSETGQLYARLQDDVVPKRGLTIDSERPLLAMYLNDPRITREVHRRTELCIPVLPIQMPLATTNDNTDIPDLAATARRLAG
jgi:AraC family transcriptional regulator